MSRPIYECDHCGACCCKLIVEIDHIDVVREPKLLAVARLHKPVGGEYEDDWEKTYSLAVASARPCPMLAADNLCTIHPTRPNTCVGFEAGDEQCQYARGAAGLAPLQPKEVPVESAV